MRTFFTFGLAYFFSSISFGQSYYYDSAYQYSNSNVELALLYADSASTVADNNKDRAKAYYMLGYLHRRTKDYMSSIEDYHKSMELYRYIDQQWYMYLQLNQGCNYELISSYEVANHYYDNTISLARELEDNDQLAKAYRQKARLYRLMERYDSAVVLNLAAQEYYDDIGNKEYRSAILNEIGLSLLESDSVGLAISYFYASARAVEMTSKSFLRTARTSYSIGSAYMVMYDTAQAVVNYNIARDMFLAARADHNYIRLLVDIAPLTDKPSDLYKEAIGYAEGNRFTNIDGYREALGAMAKLEPGIYLDRYMKAVDLLLAEKDSALSQHKQHLGKEIHDRIETDVILVDRARILKVWQWVLIVILAITMPYGSYLLWRMRRVGIVKRSIFATLNA